MDTLNGHLLKNIHYSTVSNNIKNPNTTKIDYGKLGINRKKLWWECNNERMHMYVGIEKSQKCSYENMV